MSIPSRCRAICFEAVGKPLRLAELPVAWPKAGEAIVQVEVASLSPEEIDYLRSGSAPAPLIPGQEAVGTILALGDPPPRDFSGGALEVGDRVVWSRYVSCGECFYCRRRMPQECESLLEYGRHALGDPPRLCGGMAELVHLWPKTAICKTSSGPPPRLLAPLVHAGARALAAIDALIPPVGTALILGETLEARIAAAMLRKKGASVEVLDSPCALHEADDLSMESPGRRRGVDAVLDFSGEDFAINFAVRELRIGGALSLAANGGAPRMAQVDATELVRKHVRVTGIHRYKTEHLASAVEFAAVHGGAAEVKAALADRAAPVRPFSEAEAAIQNAAEQPLMRLCFEPDQD